MVSNPHDALFKAIFERPEHARGELQSVLPRLLAEAIDWPTLVLVSGEFRGPDFAKYETDILFSARVCGGREILIYLLLEHQSTSDPHMAFRLLRYLVRIWERWRIQHGQLQPLPVIVPLVFYHGERPWSAPLSFESLVEVPSGLDDVVQPYIPSFRYLLDDVSKAADEELRRRALPVLALVAVACLRDMRHKFVLEAVAPWVQEWVDLMRALRTADDVRPLSRYVYEVKGAEQVEVFLSFIEREVGPEAMETMKTYAEELIEQGFQHGMERGLHEGIEQGKQLLTTYAEELKQRGEEAGARKILLKLLRQRFGELSPETERRVAMATTEQLEIWSPRVLSAGTVADVLAD